MNIFDPMYQFASGHVNSFSMFPTRWASLGAYLAASLAASWCLPWCLLVTPGHSKVLKLTWNSLETHLKLTWNLLEAHLKLSWRSDFDMLEACIPNFRSLRPTFRDNVSFTAKIKKVRAMDFDHWPWKYFMLDIRCLYTLDASYEEET